MAVFFGSLGSYGGLFRQFGFLWFGFRMLGFLWLSFSDVWILIVVLSGQRDASIMAAANETRQRMFF